MRIKQHILPAIAWLIVYAATVLPVGPAVAKDYVDLESVLAVDVSLSMDFDEQRLQREGYVAAFRDANIISAIQSGPNGRIAVTYFEWAGARSQTVVIPWRILRTAQEVNAFADELAAKPSTRARMTSISGAMEFSSNLFETAPVRGLRRVIDISGDGPNNAGQPVEQARDKAVASGITINGLAIRIGRSLDAYSYFDLPDLDQYYKNCVIGGPGSFVLSVRNREEFATAIRQKMLLEIAGLSPLNSPPSKPGQTAGQLHRIQHQPAAAQYDCLVGEKRWQQYRLENGDRW